MCAFWVIRVVTNLIDGMISLGLSWQKFQSQQKRPGRLQMRYNELAYGYQPQDDELSLALRGVWDLRMFRKLGLVLDK